jgi:hypothetical protein
VRDPPRQWCSMAGSKVASFPCRMAQVQIGTSLWSTLASRCRGREGHQGMITSPPATAPDSFSPTAGMARLSYGVNRFG